MTQTLKRIAIIGAGTMGHGIAQVFALAKWRVSLTDRDPDVLQRAIKRIQTNLDVCVQYGFVKPDDVSTVPVHITLVSSIEEAVAEADLVIEAVYEDLALKREVLGEIEQHSRLDAVITSNSSSFRVGDMVVALTRPARFLGTHFWNPPHIVPLVEVIQGAQTSAETVETVVHILKSVGKYPARVKQDVAGFVGNRLQHALRREAIALVAAGVASPEDVDLIARLGFGLRLPVVGPLETVDLAGLDLTLAIQSYLLPELDRSTEPASYLRDKVARGELGVKTGQGFFEWSTERTRAAIERRDTALFEMLRWLYARELIPAPDKPVE